MSTALVEVMPTLPALPDTHAKKRALDFFTAQIRNPNTREAYFRAVEGFLSWCSVNGAPQIAQVQTLHVSAYIEAHPGSDSTRKQHLAAIRRFLDWMVTGQVIPNNPAAPVRGPKVVVRRGKTPILTADECALLFQSFPETIAGKRDRALCGVMIYSFARISAALGMALQDFYPEQGKYWFRLQEKGGRQHQMPANHNAAEFMDDYIQAAGFDLLEDRVTPLFRTLGRRRCLTDNRLSRSDALLMIRRRAKAAGIKTAITPHSFRATGITLFCADGGAIDEARQMAAHADSKTTQLYNRSRDEVTSEAVERIRF